MYRGHTTAVVVPAYNEAGFVGDTIESVPAFVDRVYVVEDGSTDGTWDEIRGTAATVNDRVGRVETPDGGFDRRVVPIRHARNRGVGGAIKTGYLRAREDRIDLTAVMGGDGQMEPEMLGDLFDPIVEGRAEYTKGNRFMSRTGRGDMPAFRFVGNSVLTALTKIASGYWGSGDPQSGYTAISLHALDTADIESMYEFYGYCNDLLVKLNVADMRVADVPRPITYGDEESHITYRTYVPRVSGMLLRNFLWRLSTKHVLFDFHPLVLAYALGSVATLAGLLGFVWSVPGVGAAGSPGIRGLLALLVFSLGVGGLVAGMVLDAHANRYLDATIHHATRRDRERERDGRRSGRPAPVADPVPAGDGGEDLESGARAVAATGDSGGAGGDDAGADGVDEVGTDGDDEAATDGDEEEDTDGAGTGADDGGTGDGDPAPTDAATDDFRPST